MGDGHGLFNKQLKCGLLMAVYDYKEKVAVLVLEAGQEASMKGSVAFCTLRFPKVSRIEIRSEGKPDLRYVWDNEIWVSERYGTI
jgi:hypothetical protein